MSGCCPRRGKAAEAGGQDWALEIEGGKEGGEEAAHNAVLCETGRKGCWRE